MQKEGQLTGPGALTSSNLDFLRTFGSPSVLILDSLAGILELKERLR